MSKELNRIILHILGFGYFPYAPGTAGSVGGLLIYFWFYVADGFLITTIPFLILGFIVCSKAENVFAVKDPSQVVIDEVAGMLISLLFLPKTWPIIICAFVLFRGFDTIKIWPTDVAEKAPNGVGIMLDDIVAGIYANLSIQLALILIKSQ
jgi:Phosphatidylglycerophosphatase A and related proteins